MEYLHIDASEQQRSSTLSSELAKPIIAGKQYGFLGLQKNWVAFVYTDARVQTPSYLKNIEI